MRKSRDRFAIIFGAFITAITFLLVLDIQSGINLSSAYLPIPENVNKISNHVERNEEKNELSIENGSEHTHDFDTFTALKQNLGQQ